MHSAYGATKAALESLTKTWAVELGHDKAITVNNVNPGPVRTDMWEYGCSIPYMANDSQCLTFNC